MPRILCTTAHATTQDPCATVCRPPCCVSVSTATRCGVPLNAKQQAIIPVAAFTANGDIDKLKPALNAGLDAGMTVNKIKEVLVQMYAYAGFPRSLNASLNL